MPGLRRPMLSASTASYSNGPPLSDQSKMRYSQFIEIPILKNGLTHHDPNVQSTAYRQSRFHNILISTETPISAQNIPCEITSDD